ncbi:MAG: phosphoglycerate mutase [Anaerolineae bacterium]|nr:phosphoglycerate mutase [Anaerolineae bacterium]NIN93677.1 phosphoglycerate mutase [Anaerolineae bacterium]NIQ76724.1 phosphoglycerate mutase [Anaerolineae bacterium]
MTRLLLIRHALNDWVGKRVAGWTPGISLNEEGRKQAARLAEWLDLVPLEAIYASPLERAVETAQPIAKSHDLEVQIRDTLGETRYGELDGKSIEEAMKSDLWEQFRAYPSSTRFPGAETIYEVQVRVVGELERLLRTHSRGNIAVVTHADPIRVAVARYIGLPLDLVGRIRVSPASVTVLRLDEWGPRLTHLSHTGSLDFLGVKQDPG